MAFPASTAAVSLRASLYLAASSRRRPVLPAAVKATASSSSGSDSTSAHPVLSSLRLAASAAVLLAATSPAIACTPSPPPPTPAALTSTVSADDPIPGDDSRAFETLIVETAALARFGGAEAAHARLSAAGVAGERCARLVAAQALFVDGKVDEAIAAFEELAREDPGDYRPLFCQGVLYVVLGKGVEADSVLQRCRELAGHEFGTDLTMLVSPADAAVEDTDAESGTETVEDAAVEAEAVKV
ncbi:hypothetical protein ACP70R_027595 [Stipagrostis hirtigluma subsp. patula]